MSKRSFDFVVFCETGSKIWVAAALGPYVVAQGDSRDLAIRALERAFYGYLWFEDHDRGNGMKVKRWSSLRETGPGRLVSPSRFAEMAKTAPFVVMGNEGDTRKAYRGTVYIDDTRIEEVLKRKLP